MRTNMTPKLKIPRDKICAYCGPLATRRKLDRHHPELLKWLFDAIPEWKARHRKFLPDDIVHLCAFDHLTAHALIAPTLNEIWTSTPRRYRDEKLARECASTCSTIFWDWMEDSWAAHHQQLRWNPDPTQHNTIFFAPARIPSTHSHH